MKLYGGIDLHGNNNVIVLLDEENQIVFEKRLTNDLNTVLAQLAPYREARTKSLSSLSKELYS